MALKPGNLVAIYIERSIEMVAGLLGIWKAGAGYVPISLDEPKNRLSYLLENTQVSFVLSKSYLMNEIIEANFLGKIIDSSLIDLDNASIIDNNSIFPKIIPENIAYIFYTSGSTGKPKGVVVEHRAVWEFLETYQNEVNLKPQHRFLQLASYTFDASFQLNNGFQVIGILKNYLPDDKKSLGYASHLLWRNNFS